MCGFLSIFIFHYYPNNIPITNRIKFTNKRCCCSQATCRGRPPAAFGRRPRWESSLRRRLEASTQHGEGWFRVIEVNKGMDVSICLSICLSVYLSICLSIYLSIYLSVCLSVCLYLCVYMYVYIYI